MTNSAISGVIAYELKTGAAILFSADSKASLLTVKINNIRRILPLEQDRAVIDYAENVLSDDTWF